MCLKGVYIHLFAYLYKILYLFIKIYKNYIVYMWITFVNKYKPLFTAILSIHKN